MTGGSGVVDATEARERLETVLRDDAPFEELAERALDVGVEYFGVQNGHITAIDREMSRWEAVASTDDVGGDFHRGLTLDLQTTYCRVTVAEGGPVALHDAPNQGWADDPAYRAHHLDCYHGTPLRVGDELYGTVCFVDEIPRGEPFTESETLFAELVAEGLGRVLERRRYQADVAEHGRVLQAHREWLRGLVEASSDIVFRLDPEGAFSFVSDRVESLLGYTPRDLQGEPFTTVLQDGDPIERGRDAFRAAQGGETAELIELPLAGADDRTVYGDVRAVPVYHDLDDGDDDQDAEVAVQGVVRDVTERWRFERLVGVLNRVLRHNLRNEMNVISGLAEEIADDDDGENAARAAKIRETAAKLVDLSETARTLEKRIDQEQPSEPVDVVPMVAAAAERARSDHPTATFSLELPETARARAASTLRTSVHELLDNAASHAGETPTVRLTVTSREEAVDVTVADDGPGLRDGDAAVLRSGEETQLRHGSGLGLLLVNWLASGMDGDVAVDTDDGTAVTIRLHTPDDSG
jgi:PAS domain S-box-containing protein